MSPTCRVIAHLMDIASGREAADKHMKGVAVSALAIVEDMEEDGITDSGLEYFILLADGVLRMGNESLSVYIQDGTPDCEICAALIKRMRQT